MQGLRVFARLGVDALRGEDESVALAVELELVDAQPQRRRGVEPESETDALVAAVPDEPVVGEPARPGEGGGEVGGEVGFRVGEQVAGELAVTGGGRKPTRGNGWAWGVEWNGVFARLFNELVGYRLRHPAQDAVD